MTKAERTKQFIIEQAAPIFNEKGIAGTSIDDVLKAAKVAKGCLYGHFENKAELSYATVDYLLQSLVDRRDSLLQAQKTARGKLHAFMDMNKYPLATFIEGGCPIANLATEADDNNPVVKQKVQVVLQVAIELLTGIVHDGIRSGELAAEMNAEEYALKMFTAVEGGIMVCRTLNTNLPMQTLLKSLKKELDAYCVVAA